MYLVNNDKIENYQVKANDISTLKKIVATNYSIEKRIRETETAPMGIGHNLLLESLQTRYNKVEEYSFSETPANSLDYNIEIDAVVAKYPVIYHLLKEEPNGKDFKNLLHYIKKEPLHNYPINKDRYDKQIPENIKTKIITNYISSLNIELVEQEKIPTNKKVWKKIVKEAKENNNTITELYYQLSIKTSKNKEKVLKK